jgi:hypothetical protein
MREEKPRLTLRDVVALALFVLIVGSVLLALLAVPTCIVYWWIGMSGNVALAIDVAATASILAGIVTTAYYAD